MLALLPEILGAILAAVGAAVAFMPSTNTRNRNVAIIGAGAAIVLTGFSYYLVAETGRGLFERAACTVFPSGDYCQADLPLTAEAVIGDWEGEGAVGRGAQATQRMTLYPDGTVFIPTPGFSGEWSIAQNRLHVRVVCETCGEDPVLFSGPVVNGEYDAFAESNDNQAVRITLRRLPRTSGTAADYIE